MSFSKQQFMEERQQESETRKYSLEAIKAHRDEAEHLRQRAKLFKNQKYTHGRLLIIADKLEDMQPLSPDDRKFLKQY